MDPLLHIVWKILRSCGGAVARGEYKAGSTAITTNDTTDTTGRYLTSFQSIVPAILIDFKLIDRFSNRKYFHHLLI